MLLDIFEANTRYILTGAVVALSSYYFLRRYNKKYIYPVEVKIHNGNFLKYFDDNYEKCLIEIATKYPHDCTVTLEKSKIIILNSVDAVLKYSSGLESANIANRPQFYIFDLLSHNFKGSFFRMYSNDLKNVRKTSTNGLNQLVLNNPEAEGKLGDEIKNFIEFINANYSPNNGVLTDVRTYLQQLSANILTQVGLGIRFDYEVNNDVAVKQIIRAFTELFINGNVFDISQIDECQNIDLQKRLEFIYGFITNAVVSYKNNFDHSLETPLTFADFLILKQKELMPKNSEPYSDDDIIVQVFTVLMAAISTTGFTLSWAFYYLAKRQDIQKRIYDEMCNSRVCWKNMSNMVYTQACINEILRLSSTQPLIPRSTLNQDTQINGLTIPANTSVFINIFGMHHSMNNWSSDALEFKPDRWLDESGSLRFYSNIYLPFGSVPRKCVGDQLSKTILFSIITSFIQKYEFELVSKDSKTNDGYMGVMRCPFEYDLKIKAR